MYFSFQLLDSRILVSEFRIPNPRIPDSTSKNSLDPVFPTGVSKTPGRGLSFLKESCFRVRVDTNPNTNLTLTLKQHSLTKYRPRPTRSHFLPKVLLTFQTNFMGILVYMSRADIYTNFFHFFHSALTPSNFLVQSVLIMFTQTLRFRA